MASENADKVTIAKAFTVEIVGHGMLPIKRKSGGEKRAEKVNVTHGESKHGEETVGHCEVSEIELEAYVTPDQKHFLDIAKKALVDGENYRVDITVTELAKNKSVIKQYTYHDCLLVKLDLPRLQASSNDLITEVAAFKPQRITVTG